LNIVKLENLSSCDFDCDSGKVRVKVSSATINSTGQNMPSPYNSIVGTIPSNLKEGANVTEVFDDGIGFWKQTSCDSSNYTFQNLGAYKRVKEVDISTQTVTLLAANWTANVQTLTVTGVTTTSTNFVSIESVVNGIKWANANIYATSQAANSITFECETTPTDNITFKISILKDA